MYGVITLSDNIPKVCKLNLYPFCKTHNTADGYEVTIFAGDTFMYPWNGSLLPKKFQKDYAEREKKFKPPVGIFKLDQTQLRSPSTLKANFPWADNKAPLPERQFLLKGPGCLP